MTKAITIDPTEARKAAVLTAPEIPVNAYVRDPQAEADKYAGQRKEDWLVSRCRIFT